jgi:hypothetical protein
MKMITFAHYDYINRLNLLTQRPVYGRDLRESVKISFIMDADLFTAPTKSNKHGIPSAVFNPFCHMQERLDQERIFSEDYNEPYSCDLIEEVDEMPYYNFANEMYQNENMIGSGENENKGEQKEFVIQIDMKSVKEGK